jgi:carbonic anhydrase
MSALLAGLPNPAATPHLSAWLNVAAPVREVVRRDYSHLTDAAERATAAAEENVLFALENLRTYPAVANRLADGTLRLHGWCFKIATAELFAYDPSVSQFVPLTRR